MSQPVNNLMNTIYVVAQQLIGTALQSTDFKSFIHDYDKQRPIAPNQGTRKCRDFRQHKENGCILPRGTVVQHSGDDIMN